jgi:hypothetical protein
MTDNFVLNLKLYTSTSTCYSSIIILQLSAVMCFASDSCFGVGQGKVAFLNLVLISSWWVGLALVYTCSICYQPKLQTTNLTTNYPGQANGSALVLFTQLFAWDRGLKACLCPGQGGVVYYYLNKIRTMLL